MSSATIWQPWFGLMRRGSWWIATTSKIIHRLIVNLDMVDIADMLYTDVLQNIWLEYMNSIQLGELRIHSETGASP